MPTQKKKLPKSAVRLFKNGQQVELAGKWYCVDGRAPLGGFGDVYYVRGVRDGVRCALKVFREFRDFTEGEPAGKAQEIVLKYKKLFKREWTNLRMMSKEFPDRFPAFYGSGEFAGRPYYLMEKLEPISTRDLRNLANDEQRKLFMCDVFDAVSALHSKKLVHFDIKPSNILKRWDVRTNDRVAYVLGDFGSVHREERHETRENPNSLNKLKDGRRLMGRSDGYKDPMDDKHTVHADIHALGQVMRDMFEENVPPLWSWIIMKCISRNSRYRYNSVSDVKQDVLQMERRGASMLSASLTELLSEEGITWARDMRRTYVSASYHGVERGTEDAPYRTIMRAVAAAPAGSTVVVMPGSYRENILIEKKMLRLVSQEGAKETVVTAAEKDSVFKIRKAGDGSYVKGFTFTGGLGDAVESSYGHDYRGGGVFCAGSATVTDCIIKGNGIGEPKKSSGTFGGGVYVTTGTVRVINCLIEENMAWASGAGLFVDGNGAALVVTSCTVRNNRTIPFFGARGGIGLANAAVLSVSKCMIYDNDGDQIGAISAVYAHETRAEVMESFVMNGVRSCNIHHFFDRQNNYKTRKVAEGVCGCRISF